MKILGIDPGYAIVGFGAVEYNGYSFKMLDYGAITTNAGVRFDLRLNDIYDGMCALLSRVRPDALSIERLYFTTNHTTAIDVAQARGVILLSAVRSGVPVFEYTPLQVKQSIVGYGKAEKKQVMEMTRIFLHLDAVPKPDDAADALALAICHAHSASSRIPHSAAVKNMNSLK